MNYNNLIALSCIKFWAMKCWCKKMFKNFFMKPFRRKITHQRKVALSYIIFTGNNCLNTIQIPNVKDGVSHSSSLNSQFMKLNRNTSKQPDSASVIHHFQFKFFISVSSWHFYLSEIKVPLQITLFWNSQKHCYIPNWKYSLGVIRKNWLR